jgi:hypothetical protein
LANDDLSGLGETGGITGIVGERWQRLAKLVLAAIIDVGNNRKVTYILHS